MRGGRLRVRCSVAQMVLQVFPVREGGTGSPQLLHFLTEQTAHRFERGPEG